MIINQHEMSRKIWNILLFTCIINFSLAANVGAETKAEHKVLVIYSSQDGEIDEYQRTLDLLIGHFTTDITFKSSQEVKKEDLTEITHLFYYGQVAEKIPVSFFSLFDEYTGHFMAFGYNPEHLGDQFTFVNPLHEKVVDQLFLANDVEKKLNITPEYVIDVQVLAGSEVLVEGTRTGDASTYPIAIKNDNKYYFAIDNFNAEKTIIVGEVLHEFFQADHEPVHPAYIRLEDIHPLVNPQNVKEITEILKEKDIPYMMAVIPVYTNPETGKKHHFSDSPKLLKVLKDAQKNGGSIVLHGYTHQFRESETGEGFEFWDVENNTPIYADADKSFTLRKEGEFANKKDYESYMKKLTKYETNYIETKVTRGIQELTNYGLFPLAFEAPHYTMSQNGYQVLSNYFSMYVGQIQLSDKDWEIMGTSPYNTTPSFLNGMEVLPETMGYVQPEDSETIPNMFERADKLQITEDGTMGAFYHPYLGVDKFKELINRMEKLPNISWVDLRQEDVWVKAENIEIHTVNGEIIANVKQGALYLTSIDFLAYDLNRFIGFLIWVIAITGGMAVIVFIGFTMYLFNRNVEMEG